MSASTSTEIAARLLCRSNGRVCCLLRQGAAVLARIAAASPNGALQNSDELGAAGRNRVVRPHLDPVAQLPELLDLIRRNPSLDYKCVATVTVAREVHGFLGAHAVV